MRSSSKRLLVFPSDVYASINWLCLLYGLYKNIGGHYATSRKVTCSIPDEVIGFLN
jgi:hypothetical protein